MDEDIFFGRPITLPRLRISDMFPTFPNAASQSQACHISCIIYHYVIGSKHQTIVSPLCCGVIGTIVLLLSLPFLPSYP